jgi:murein DD-endopeptidase MepM/ murein hydrolase activator NlpD
MAALLLVSAPAASFELSGQATQGGLVFGQVAPGSTVWLDGQEVLVSDDGRFVVGFGRDETGSRELKVAEAGQPVRTETLEIQMRDYAVERVDGVPQRTVIPDPEAAERIRAEARMVATARARRDLGPAWSGGFEWPAQGRISGVYGSQRVLNGTPGRPHFGVDIAAPTGTPVYAPAAGLVTLTHPDMYYSGGTIVLDHGQGLSSTFLHLSEVSVESGTWVQQGDLIGKIGMTGRASGPHLDWRMNWLDRRVDPQRLVRTENGRTAP